MNNQPIFLSTTPSIPGYRTVETRGIVFGVTVRSRGMGGECSAGCQSVCGGEVSAYTQIVIDGRNEALNRMVADAKARGANAVVGLRFDSDQMGNQSANSAVVANGTAVVVVPL